MKSFLMFLLAICTSVCAAEWENLGMGAAGALFAPAVSPHDPNLMFVSTDMSGFFRSENAGRDWKLLEESMIITTFNSQVCFHPKDPNIIYTGSAQGLQVSNDKGETWKVIPEKPLWQPGSIVNSVEIDRDNTDYMLLSCGSDYYRSLDAGKTWEAMQGITGHTFEHWVGYFNIYSKGGNSFIGTTEGIFTSADSGKTWKYVSASLPKLSGFAAGIDQKGTIVLYCIAGGKLHKSIDRGETWQELKAEGIDEKLKLYQVVCASNKADNLYVSTRDENVVYKSVDGGGKWASVYHPDLNGGNVELGWVSYENGIGWGGPLVLGMSVSASNPDAVLATNMGEAFATLDGGQRWYQAYCRPLDGAKKGGRWKSNGLEVTNVTYFCANPHDPRIQYAFYSDIGLCRSEDGGDTWCQSITGSPWVNCFYGMAFDPDVPGLCYAAASDQHDIPGWDWFSTVKAPGGVLTSTDYGRSWKATSDGLPKAPADSIVITKDKTLFVGILTKGVYRSTDGGKTWIQKSNGLQKPSNTSINVVGLEYHKKSGNLYAMVEGKQVGPKFPETGGLFVSRDNGESWSCLLDIAWGGRYIAVHPDNENIIYATMSAIPGSDGIDGVYKTQDGGKSWKHLAIDFPERIYPFAHLSGVFIPEDKPNMVYVASPTHGILVSEDNGGTFKLGDRPPFKGTNVVGWVGSKMYVGTCGGGLWRKR